LVEVTIEPFKFGGAVLPWTSLPISHRSTLSIVLKVKEPTVAVRLRLVTLDGNWATINSCSTGLAEKSRFGEIVISSRPF